jgi:uncharacterized membrane protein (DUF2068 family)
MGRPVGVTILAILYFLGALCGVLGGIGVIAGGGFMATLANQAQAQASGAGAAGLIAGLGAVFGVILLVVAAIYALLGWGMWKLKNWARILTIILLALGVAFELFGLVGIVAHFNLFALIWILFWAAIDVLIIWYLLKADVKAAFQGGHAGAAAA